MISKVAVHCVILIIYFMGCSSIPNDYDQHIKKNIPLKNSNYVTEQFLNRKQKKLDDKFTKLATDLKTENLKNMEDKFTELTTDLNSEKVLFLQTQLENKNQLLKMYQKVESLGQQVQSVEENSKTIEIMKSIIKENQNQIARLTLKMDENNDITKELYNQIKENKVTILLLVNNNKELNTQIQETKETIIHSVNNTKELDNILVENIENITTAIATATTAVAIATTTTTTTSTALLPTFPKNCYDVLKEGVAESGVQTIHPFLGNHFGVEAYCDQNDLDGGWTIIQRRENLTVREDFYRSWNDYEEGFGNPAGEYWLGLKTIHALTESKQMELMVRLEGFVGEKGYAHYRTFSIGDALQNYRLKVGDYEGDAGNDLRVHNGKMFSTKDNDNDEFIANCSEYEKGGWWYNNNGCGNSNLNGPAAVVGTEWQKIYWLDFNGHKPLRRTVMMVRPRDT